jgi:hypothetical protein
MTRSMNLRIAALCCAGLAGCATPAAVSPVLPPISDACVGMTTAGPEADQVRRLEERGARANVEGWSIEEARAFFAPEWVSVQPSGSSSDLETVLSGFRNGRSVPWAGRFDITNLDVRVYCDTALAVGRAEAYQVGASSADARPAARFRWLNVWRKSNGRWVLTANQFTRF